AGRRSCALLCPRPGGGRGTSAGISPALNANAAGPSAGARIRVNSRRGSDARAVEWDSRGPGEKNEKLKWSLTSDLAGFLIRVLGRETPCEPEVCKERSLPRRGGGPDVVHRHPILTPLAGTG